MARVPTQEQGALRTAFSRVTATDTVEVDQLTEALAQLGLTPGAQEVEKILAATGLDGKHSLSFADFAQVCDELAGGDGGTS